MARFLRRAVEFVQVVLLRHDTTLIEQTKQLQRKTQQLRAIREAKEAEMEETALRNLRSMVAEMHTMKNNIDQIKEAAKEMAEGLFKQAEQQVRQQHLAELDRLAHDAIVGKAGANDYDGQPHGQPHHDDHNATMRRVVALARLIAQDESMNMGGVDGAASATSATALPSGAIDAAVGSEADSRLDQEPDSIMLKNKSMDVSAGDGSSPK